MIRQRENSSRKSASRGFTLLEVLLSLAIFAVALPILSSLFSGGMKQPVIAREQAQAVFLAQELMEEILTRKWDENATPPGPTNNPGVIGIDTGETVSVRSGLDDIDDYDGLMDNPMHSADGATLTTFQTFWSQVQVNYVGSDASTPDLETFLAKNAGSEFKRVDVTVNWAGGRLTLTTVRGNF
ncbi:MAG: prepilin-type N-terminal cleavage/methylation domain-containing protein [bacterium]